MSTSDVRYPTGGGKGDNAMPATFSPPYNSTLPTPPAETASGRKTRCATGVRFMTTIHGILNVIIMVALFCVLISAGVANRQDGIDADDSPLSSKAKVSAFHTRNAVLVFAAFGLFFIIVDTILHVTRLITRLPAVFDLAFIILMLVFAVIFLILGCCAAAWEQKMRDKVPYTLKRKGAAASAAFWLFIAMISIVVNYALRLTSQPSQSSSPSAIINRNAYDLQMDSDTRSRY